jgi:hypothetical protein
MATELPSERYWRLARLAEERANRSAMNLDREAADRHNDRAAALEDLARAAQREGH